jgi:hypothetical protein
MYGWKQNGFGALAPPPSNVQAAIANACANYPNVPCSLIQSVAQQESSYDPTVTSPEGAQGLMQIMPANDASLHVSNPFDPTQSANAGAALLQTYYNQYGTWTQALEAYNQGPGSIASNGASTGAMDYASQVLLNAGIDQNLASMGPPSIDGTDTSTDAGDSSLFDFSSLQFTDSSGSLTGVAYVGIAAAALLLIVVVGN